MKPEQTLQNWAGKQLCAGYLCERTLLRTVKRGPKRRKVILLPRVRGGSRLTIAGAGWSPGESDSRAASLPRLLGKRDANTDKEPHRCNGGPTEWARWAGTYCSQEGPHLLRRFVHFTCRRSASQRRRFLFLLLSRCVGQTGAGWHLCEPLGD